jgi:hypothetical protein
VDVRRNVFTHKRTAAAFRPRRSGYSGSPRKNLTARAPAARER